MTWISVKDKVPEPHKDVLFAAGRVMVGYWSEGWGWLDYMTDNYHPGEYVTHWMYLPEMPSDE